VNRTLEEDYDDFLEIQGLKGETDVSRVTTELGFSEEELFEFVNRRVAILQEHGINPQTVGEYLGTLFLFGYWLRGVRGIDRS